jgi:hypothetical protein
MERAVQFNDDLMLRRRFLVHYSFVSSVADKERISFLVDLLIVMIERQTVLPFIIPVKSHRVHTSFQLGIILSISGNNRIITITPL